MIKSTRFERITMMVLILTAFTFAIFSNFPSVEARIGSFEVAIILLLLWLKDLDSKRNITATILLFVANFFYTIVNAFILQQGLPETFNQYHFDPLQLCYFGHGPFLFVMLLIIILILFNKQITEGETEE